MEVLIKAGIDLLVTFATDYLILFMVCTFVLGLLLRSVVYFTVWQEFRFISEFEKRVFKHLTHADENQNKLHFHPLTQTLLEGTYCEHYQLKKKYMRRRFDYISTLTDRAFMIQDGATRLIKDILKQTQYLQRTSDRPNFSSLSKFVVTSNPIFNRIWGVLPMGLINDVLNILPGLFVIGGIFGTFLGVMRALPELTGIDISDVESTKMVMDAFLVRISFSMSTSIVGIILSVGMTVLNAVMAPDTPYINLVNKLTSSLEFLWNDTDPKVRQLSDVAPTPKEQNHFDWQRDPYLGDKLPADSEKHKKDRRKQVFAPRPAASETENKNKPVIALPAKIDEVSEKKKKEQEIKKAIEAKISELKSKIQSIESQLKKNDEQKESGKVSETEWKKKRGTLLVDKEIFEEALTEANAKLSNSAA